ncbi:MAG: FecR domain-containing protein [Polyangiaceae bacterium]
MDAERRQAQRQRVARAIEARARQTRESTACAPTTSTNRGTLRRFGWALGLAAGVALGAAGFRAASTTEHAASVAVAKQPGQVEFVEGDVKVLRPGRPEMRVAASHALAQGDIVRTAPTARANVKLLANVEIEMAASTELRLGDTTRLRDSEVWLEQGRARFDVAKRPADGKFAVHSPDTDVIVHGTSFTVEVRTLETGVRTTVSVTEGLVSVVGAGKTAWLRAGDRWASREEPVSSPTEPRAAVPTPNRARTPEGAKSDRVPTSTLAAESRALETAMAAKRRGDDTEALRQLEQFLRDYPSSPLAPNARVERFRVLKHLGRDDQAASAAREYMATDPNGFARDEAKGLAIPSDAAVPRSTVPRTGNEP